MSGIQSAASDIDVDLGRLFGSLARRWKRIVLVTAAVTALAVVAAWLATPHYKAETRILIETRESVFTRPQSNGENERPILDEEGVTSQVEVILSTDLLKQVAAKLNLASLPEFDEAADMSLPARLLVIAGLKSDPAEIAPEERVLKAFREKLSVYRVEKSRVIVIEMSSEDPKLAAQIPNELADAYIAVQGAAKQQSNSEATDWLEPEIANLTKRVKEAEERVANFRAQSDLLIGQNNSVLATQQLSELSTELSRVRASRSSAEATAESVRSVLQSGASLDALPEVLSSTLIQRLRERQVQLKADIADLSTTLLDNHPRIRALRSQLVDLDRQIRTEAENVLRGLATEAKTAQLREQQLVSDLNTLKAESARAGEQEVELRALEREAASQRALLESYMTRYREASSRRDGNYLPADARTFSRAVTPSEPYFPKVLPIAGAAFVASLLIMAVITLLQELFSGRAMRPATSSRVERVDDVVMPVVAAREPARPASDETALRADSTAPAEPIAGSDEVFAVGSEEPAVEPEVPHAAELSSIDSFAPVPAPSKRTPFVLEPVKRESFREAWSKRRELEESIRREFTARQPAPTPLPVREAANTPGEAPPAPSLGQIGIEGAAERLISENRSRAIFVSPEGDDAAAAAVLVAREIADAGLRVLLLDLTATGAASLPMLESLTYPGITNLLASEAQFTDVIHEDLFSECHIMPVGTADPSRAMRAADRLPIIMESLTTAYDIVIVECGPADADGIRRLVADGTEVLVSMIEADDEVAEAAAQLKAGGYPDITLVTSSGHLPPNPPMPGRSAA